MNRVGEVFPALVPVVVIVASIIGSIHCVGMCGPLALTASTQGKGGIVYYHLGRFLGYFCVGALAGFLGAEFVQSEMKYLSLISSILIGIICLIAGYRIIKNGQLALKQPSFLRQFYQKRVGRLLGVKTSRIVPSLLIGLLSPLLPCGWLYGFILMAVATNSALWGGVLLASFWLGTLPALSGIALLAKRPITYFHGKAPLFFGVVLMFMGFISLVVKLKNLTTGACH
ncbi:MAG: sulfite exporter TauE/SafE family protein [Candidatus Scalindua sp. AMX11]|nr:MAG: sulfite exporter TauE/SafE family protein [Candidatus Scalindua sp.]TDE64176.1 MAG: sulfite exporter TauE/SafE family protein [Candidatus Scalindua sp. AMX11]